MPYYRTRDNQQLYVRIIGRGKPVVLLHGFATHSGPWLPYVLPHSLKYKFYLPDFRCFGKSQDAQLVGDCPLTNFADDLTDMLYNFDISTFKLGGISMGAYASLKYFQKYGQSRVSHYIHMDQSPQVLNNNSWRFGIFGAKQEIHFQELFEIIKQYDKFPENLPYQDLPQDFKDLLAKKFGDFMSFCFKSGLSKASSKVLFKVENFSDKILPLKNWRSYIKILKAYLYNDYDFRPFLKHIKIPVDIWSGLLSEMYPYEGQFYMHQNIPSSKWIPFKRSGHAPLLNQPFKFCFELGK